MMKRRAAAVGAVLAAFCLTTAFSVQADETEQAAQTEQTVEVMPAPELIGSKEAMVYQGTLDSKDTLTTWEVAGEEYVPYISLTEYIKLLYKGTFIPEVKFSWDGNVFLITHNDQDIFVDLDEQSISCYDWKEFTGPAAPGAIPAGVVEGSEFISIRPSVKNSSGQTETDGYEIDLADYGIQMLRLEDDVLMPFAAAQSAFGSTSQKGIFAYNGENYFDIVTVVDYIYGNASNTDAPNPYADMYYSGPFASLTETSEAYARYNYGSMCMLLDLTYGHKEEKGITDFDTFFTENGMKDAFLSTDPKDDEEALRTLFTKVFDSGHDAELMEKSLIATPVNIYKEVLIHELLRLVGYESVSELNEDLTTVVDILTRIVGKFTDKAKFMTDEIMEMLKDKVGPNVLNILMDNMRLKNLRPFFFKNNTVKIEGETAVIYFESFIEDLTRSESYYTKLPGKSDIDKSSFALFYYAFDQIKRDGNVKNVVIDVSYNGGGSAAALVSLLGFLSEDGETCITYKDTLNNNYCTEYYHIDTNLDGRFDDEDGYGGQYDFYILTSGYSYSCGNALPYFAQVNKLAKIIGEKPGGGDCVVGYFVDAFGRVGAMSGFMKLGTMNGDTFTSDERAVKVDLPFPKDEADDIYFHSDRIAAFVEASK